MDDLSIAKMLATERHHKQRHMYVLPYTHHLQEVEYVLHRFKEVETPDFLFVAAWLHDILEDTETKMRELQEKFGDKVADVVQAVTDAEGPTRAARKALTYPKTRAGGKWAVRLKLADRVANLENRGRYFDVYCKEHEDFRRSLYTKGENEDMWEYLDNLVKGT